MPELATEALHAFAYALRRGFPFESWGDVLDRVRREAAAGFRGNPAVTRMKKQGSANLGLYLLRFGDDQVLQKRVVSVDEFRIARSLQHAHAGRSLAQIVSVARRGAVFHIFQEYIPHKADKLSPVEMAQLAYDFSSETQAPLEQVAPSHMGIYRPLLKPRYVQRIARLTGDTPSSVRRGLGAMIDRPAAIQHNDQHPSNLRRREDGSTVFVDMGSVGWNLPGAGLRGFAADGLAGADRTAFDEATGHFAGLSGVDVREIRQAVLLAAAARQLRRARRHHDRDREEKAMRIAAEVLSLD